MLAPNIAASTLVRPRTYEPDTLIYSLRYFCNLTLFVFEKRNCNHRINTFDTIAQTKRTLKHYDNFFADWNPEMPYFHSMAKSKFLYVSFKKYSKQSTT